MAIQLDLPEGLAQARDRAGMAARMLLRPISRKYDTAEHTYPKELDEFGKLTKQAARDGGEAKSVPKEAPKPEPGAAVNGRQMFGVVSVEQLCWGDTGLMLARPGNGLGNAAIAAAGTPEQREKFRDCYASMAITEPQAGSDSKEIRTTAVLDGDQWVLNGEKIFVTDGERSDTVVVWATLNREMGKAAIRSFVVPKGTPGLEVARLERKLGIRASDTATILLDDCRVPRENLLGGREQIETGDSRASFGAAMQTFDNTRPLVASMAVGCAQAALDTAREVLAAHGWEEPDDDRALLDRDATAAELLRMEAEVEAARLLTFKAAWMADNGQPNSCQASMSKAKAGRICNEVTLRCVEMCGAVGYGETELLEKFARDSKILDIFEGTQQIQQLIIARHLLQLGSSQLR